MGTRSTAEEAFALSWRALRFPAPVREHRFAADRQWRFDFAWPDYMVAVEIEGGIRDFSVTLKDGKVLHRGRHARKAGFEADCEKYNAAAFAGWRVIRLVPSMIQPKLLEQIRSLLQ